MKFGKELKPQSESSNLVISLFSNTLISCLVIMTIQDFSRVEMFENYLYLLFLWLESGQSKGYFIMYNIFSECRGVVPWGAGVDMVPPDFGISVNPTLSQPGGGGKLCPSNNTGNSGVSDLPTVLECTLWYSVSCSNKHPVLNFLKNSLLNILYIESPSTWKSRRSEKSILKVQSKNNLFLQ